MAPSAPLTTAAAAAATVLALLSPCAALLHPHSSRRGAVRRAPLPPLPAASDDRATSDDPSVSRRSFNYGGAALALGLSGASANSLYRRTPSDYPLWPVLPVGPYKRKATVRQTVVPGKIYTLDQKFGILNVQVPVRTTVIVLEGGGLFVYDPIAATDECIGLLRELEAEFGAVKHILLGSVAIEHKVYGGPFAQRFPGADVWTVPGQYSFPTDLPLFTLGYPAGRTREVPSSAAEYPAAWVASGIEIATLGPLISKDGAFAETVVYHRPTKTLLVTDTVLEVSADVPVAFEEDPAPLLYHARDTVSDVVADTPEVRRRGWQRVALFALFFNPKDIAIKTTDVALQERMPQINPDFAGIYPWDWVGDKGQASFRALTGGLLVSVPPPHTRSERAATTRPSHAPHAPHRSPRSCSSSS